MRPWVKRGAVAAAATLALIQFVRPATTNPPLDPARSVHAGLPDGSAAAAAIDRSCRDCHSHATVWPWYAHVAPTSWLVAHDVNEGREALNFSEWKGYGQEQQGKLLSKTCEEATEREMPPRIYTLIHTDAVLTTQDIDALCRLAPGAGADID